MGENAPANDLPDPSKEKELDLPGPDDPAPDPPVEKAPDADDQE